MKKSHILIAVAIIAALTMTGCKNNKKNQEPTQEEVQAQKQALADSVLAKIDSLVEEYEKASDESFNMYKFTLTEAEKMVKPDYLLDPSEANSLLTRAQKINALGIYIMELGLRQIYDMPSEEVSEVIAKLFIEISPNDYSECFETGGPFSSTVKAFYQQAKENNEIQLFWQFQNALFVETSYITANSPDLFFDRITEEQWQAYSTSFSTIFNAICFLAEYDDEMAALRDLITQNDPHSSREESHQSNSTKESAKQFRIVNKDKYIARRNALLQ